MDRKEAYQIYVRTAKGKSTLVIPDFEVNSELEAAKTLAEVKETARKVIENLAKEYEDDGKEIPKPGSVPYKKEKGYIMTYVDVNLDRLMRKAKLEELEKLEEGRVHSMWDVRENVIEFLLNQKVMAVTLTQRKLANRVKEYAEKYPDEVRIVKENDDGSIFAKMPTRYLRIVRPSEGRTLTEEEKEASRKRLELGRQKRMENLGRAEFVEDEELDGVEPDAWNDNTSDEEALEAEL